MDGLRVDAVASMLYLDYGKNDGQWVANKYGGNENLEAIEFLQASEYSGSGKKPRYCDDCRGVYGMAEGDRKSRKTTDLDFSLKWNMGWMHDFLEYMKLDPYFRKDATITR